MPRACRPRKEYDDAERRANNRTDGYIQDAATSPEGEDGTGHPSGGNGHWQRDFQGPDRPLAWQARLIPGTGPVWGLLPGDQCRSGPRDLPAGSPGPDPARFRRVHLLPHANQPALLQSAPRDAERHPRADVSESVPFAADKAWAGVRLSGGGGPVFVCAG